TMAGVTGMGRFTVLVPAAVVERNTVTNTASDGWNVHGPNAASLRVLLSQSAQGRLGAALPSVTVKAALPLDGAPPVVPIVGMPETPAQPVPICPISAALRANNDTAKS